MESTYQTRTSLLGLLDHALLYGQAGSLAEAESLIGDLPPFNLILFLARINRQIYLKDKGNDFLTQLALIEAFDPSIKNLLPEVASKVQMPVQAMVIFY